MARRLAAIMFTDIAGYTALSQTDEAAALRLLQDQERLVRGLLEIHRGRLVKSIGDGLLIEFANALDAVECAVDLQHHIRERNAREPTPPLRVRIGIHLGDVEGSGSDILGDAVNVASRVEPLAEPGGICLTAAVHDQIQNRGSFQLEGLGAKTLKGIRSPVGVYRLVLSREGGAPRPNEPGPPRLAVLPLQNISPDPSDDYFADGLTEELITVLSQIKGLRVISRTSASQYKGTTKSIAQIGSELGADSVLEGSVRKAGDQLRIAVQLIDTKTDEHRWAQTYDRKLENVFAIQADIAELAAGALKQQLLTAERGAIRERPTSSLAAYEYYLRGIQASQRWDELGGWSEAADQEAVKYLEAAIAEDPKFAAAYSFLASHLIAVMGQTRPSRQVIPRARELVAKALELNPRSPETHIARGLLAMQADLDWTRAEAEFQEAIVLNPSSSQARFWYGLLLEALQRFDEARKQWLASIELDPLWTVLKLRVAILPLRLGDIDAWIASWERLAQLYPEDLNVRVPLARCYALVGRTADAMRLVDSLPRGTDLLSRGRRASILAILGHPDELRALLTDWEKGRIERYVPLDLAAYWCAMVGETERALSLLEQDYQNGDRAFWLSYQDTGFDGIRENPRFRAILRAMHLPTTLSRTLRFSSEPSARGPSGGLV